MIKLAGQRGASTCTEPEAAAIAYAYRDRVPEGAKLAVYDLGGGTFDAAVLVRDGDRVPAGREPRTGSNTWAASTSTRRCCQHVLGQLGPAVQQLGRHGPGHPARPQPAAPGLRDRQGDAVQRRRGGDPGGPARDLHLHPDHPGRVRGDGAPGDRRDGVGHAAVAGLGRGRAGRAARDRHGRWFVADPAGRPRSWRRRSAARWPMDNHPKHDVALGAAIRAMEPTHPYAAPAPPRPAPSSQSAPTIQPVPANQPGQPSGPGYGNGPGRPNGLGQPHGSGQSVGGSVPSAAAYAAAAPPSWAPTPPPPRRHGAPDHRPVRPPGAAGRAAVAAATRPGIGIPTAPTRRGARSGTRGPPRPPSPDRPQPPERAGSPALDHDRRHRRRRRAGDRARGHWSSRGPAAVVAVGGETTTATTEPTETSVAPAPAPAGLTGAAAGRRDHLAAAPERQLGHHDDHLFRRGRPAAGRQPGGGRRSADLPGPADRLLPARHRPWDPGGAGGGRRRLRRPPLFDPVPEGCGNVVAARLRGQAGAAAGAAVHRPGDRRNDAEGGPARTAPSCATSSAAGSATRP